MSKETVFFSDLFTLLHFLQREESERSAYELFLIIKIDLVSYYKTRKLEEWGEERKEGRKVSPPR